MTDIVTHTQRLHIRLEHLDTLSLSGFFINHQINLCTNGLNNEHTEFNRKETTSSMSRLHT